MTQRTSPDINDIIDLFSNESLSAFITGHLILESILIQLLETKLHLNSIIRTNFPTKINKCMQFGFFDRRMGDFLNSINRTRNKFAHRLRHNLTFDDVFELAKEAKQAGVDFSDDAIHSNKELSYTWYGKEGVIQEIFQNTAIDLSFLFEKFGGEFHFG